MGEAKIQLFQAKIVGDPETHIFQARNIYLILGFLQPSTGERGQRFLNRQMNWILFGHIKRHQYFKHLVCERSSQVLIAPFEDTHPARLLRAYTCFINKNYFHCGLGAMESEKQVSNKASDAARDVDGVQENEASISAVDNLVYQSAKRVDILHPEVHDARCRLKQYHERRAWDAVNSFYKDLVTGQAKLSEVNPRLKDVYAPCLSERWEPDQEGRMSSQECKGTGTAIGKRPLEPDREESPTHKNLKVAPDAPQPDPKHTHNKKDKRITYRLTVGYHGPAFCGYMKQPDARTVQGTLGASVTPLLQDGKHAFFPGAGRTDKGVHASAQVNVMHPNRVK